MYKVIAWDSMTPASAENYHSGKKVKTIRTARRQASKLTQNYVHIYKRQPDGFWQLAESPKRAESARQ